MAEEKRFREQISQIVLLEAADDEGSSPPNGGRKVRGVGAIADVMNLNRHLYPAAVLATAVERAKQNPALTGYLLVGEADHPDWAPRILDTVVKWTDIEFDIDSNSVIVEGVMLPTRAGKDVLAIMESGVLPGLSLRGYGYSDYEEDEDGYPYERVTDLTFSGIDLVFEPAFPEAGIKALEQHQLGENQDMKRKLGEQGNPAVIEEEVEEVEVEAGEGEDVEAGEETPEADPAPVVESKRKPAGVSAAAVRKLETQLQAQQREAAEAAAREKKLAEQMAAVQKELDEMQRQREVAAAIAEHTAKLPYTGALLTQFVANVQGMAGKLANADEVKAYVENKRTEYDALAAAIQTQAMGMRPRGGVVVVGPAFEQETGMPEFARAAHAFSEQMVKRHLAQHRDPRKAKSPAELHTVQYLAAFDKAYRSQLMQEANDLQQWQEAESTADLNLPYSVSRAIIAEVGPQLVAANIFDFGLTDSNPTRLFFESYTAESGAAPSVSDEEVTADEGEWADLDNKRIRRGTVVVTSNDGNTTYVENEDYLIDYANGRLYTLADGDITDGVTLKVDYTYDKIRAGEGQGIQRGKAGLNHTDISVAADRLATLINDEAIAFASSQLGWDAVTRTINMLIREIRESIDAGVFGLAIDQAIISGNSGGTWTSASETVDALITKMGVARVAVQNDFYEPTAFVMSKTNADRVSNWPGLARDGFPDSMLGSAGFESMRVKGLPVFSTTTMPDNVILVTHPELVQHRVYSLRPLSLKGPFHARDDNGLLISAQEWFVEEYNATTSVIANKGGYVLVA